MATQDTKARAIQLVRTEDNLAAGTVRFYDRRETNAQKAFIGEIRLQEQMKGEYALSVVPTAIVKAAMHGYTQNVLDSSNKLTGDERVEFIAKAIETINAGGWSSAPQDVEKTRANAIAALVKLGMSQAAAEAAVASI